MNNEQEFSIDLLDLFRVIWKNILPIILVAVLMGSAAFGVSAFMMEPEYQATVSMYANSSSFNLGVSDFAISTADLNTSSSLVSVFLYILESRTTLEEVIKTANLPYTPSQLRRDMVSASGVSSTGAFEVTITSHSPTEAELIANTFAEVLPDRIGEIVDGTEVRIVDYAIIPAGRSGPNILLYTALGIILGGFLSAAVVVIRSLLNDQSGEMIKSADDLRALYPDIMLLAVVPDMRVAEKGGYYSSYYGPANKKNSKKADSRKAEMLKKGGKLNGK